MPEYPCFCGRGFSLRRSEHKSLIQSVEQFCSVDCFNSYLRYFPVKRYDLPEVCKSPFVSEVRECFDPVTQESYRSWFECHVARFLVTQGFNYRYETQCVYLNSGGHYTPDFWLPEQGVFLEVKGKWAMSAKTKFQTALLQGYNMVLVPWHLAAEFRRLYGQRVEPGHVR